MKSNNKQARSVTVDLGNNKSYNKSYIGSREKGNNYGHKLIIRSNNFYSNKHLHNTNNGHQLPRGTQKNHNNDKPRSVTFMNDSGEIQKVAYTPPKIDPTNYQEDNRTQKILKASKFEQQMSFALRVQQEEESREAKLYGGREDLIEGNVHPSGKNYRIAPHLLDNYRKNNNDKGNLNIRNQSTNPSGSQLAAKLGYTPKIRSITINPENQFAKTPNNKDNSLFSTFNNTSSQNTFYSESNHGDMQSTQASIKIAQSSIGLPSITPKLTKNQGANELLIPPVFKRLYVPSKTKVGQGNPNQEIINEEKAAQRKKNSEQQKLKEIEKRIIKFAIPLNNALEKADMSEYKADWATFSPAEQHIVQAFFYFKKRGVSENVYTLAEENELRVLEQEMNEMRNGSRRKNYMNYKNSDVEPNSSENRSIITKNLKRKQIPIQKFIKDVQDTKAQIENLNLFVPNVSFNLNENINGNIKKPISYHRRVKNNPNKKE